MRTMSLFRFVKSCKNTNYLNDGITGCTKVITFNCCSFKKKYNANTLLCARNMDFLIIP